ncbi:MAG: 1-acyl-sn-glycerol-3-phosphate acyltransferase [Flavobacteriia bacterium]|nr:1-acyl-sn-glycerol-3-phosphate acyltransferase [Flavobacteriia bacterium]
MRIFYFILKIILQYSLRIYYRPIVFNNAPKRFFGRTIFVSNHVSSFMDPLVVAVLQNPIVFFMTRSDVFTPVTRPILWSAQMLPIYREHDGEDTKGKNQEVFKKCNQVLKYGRNLLVFGEGFTDDVFIRRLKPIKKGTAKIGFGALESMNWKKKIYIQAIGINYTEPSVLGSSILISNSNKFCLNDYKEQYLENPAKTINDVTKRIEELIKEQITHVENKNWLTFHEHISRLLSNGLHHQDFNPKKSLKTRWKNSRKLALWMNEQNLDENQELTSLKDELDTYFRLLKKTKVEERHVAEMTEKQKLSTKTQLLKMLLYAPFVPIGLIHFFFLYRFIKNFVEKKFRRKVFWSSVKMVMGLILMGILMIPIVMIYHHTFIHDFWVSLLVYLFLPFFGLYTYQWFKAYKEYKIRKYWSKKTLSSFVEKRKVLLSKIQVLIPKL